MPNCVNSTTEENAQKVKIVISNTQQSAKHIAFMA